MSLKFKAISGVKWTASSTVFNTLIQLAKLSLLARFLEPVDFGLMGIMSVVIGFGEAFMDMGISNAIIHRQQISDSQLSSLYWFNLITGLTLTIIVAAASPFLSVFYAEPRIVKLLILLSSVFTIVAVGNQYRILCQKELQFRRIAKIEVSSNTLSFLVALYLAILGYGIYALIFASLSQALISSSFYLYLGLRDFHRPALIFQPQELNGFISFGLFQIGERLINYLGGNIDKLLISKVLGMEIAGFYNMAWQLIIFPVLKINPIITRVSFPIFAKLQQDKTALRKYYAFNVKCLSLITVPILIFLHFFSKDSVILMFGTQWIQVADLVKILSFVGIIKALGNPGGSIILALGYVAVGFWWNLAWAIMVSVTLILTIYLAPEIKMLALALLVLSLTTGLIWHYIIARITQLNYQSIVKHFLRIIIVSTLICFTTSLIIDLLTLDLAIFRLSTAIVICCVFYTAYIFAFEQKLIKQMKKGNN